MNIAQMQPPMIRLAILSGETVGKVGQATPKIWKIAQNGGFGAANAKF
ncbi:hypothetical protein [Moraxella marmotae]